MEVIVLDTGSHSAVENMAVDQKFLSDLENGQTPILHLYEWNKPSITYGHFAKPERLLNMKEVEKAGIELARRSTGGGLTLHFTDYAFSFLMPSDHPNFSSNTLENYRFVNHLVYQSVQSLIEEERGLSYYNESEKGKVDEALNFCMAKPTKYDVLYKGKKVGGAAQRKTAKGYLHHGTISLALPDSELLEKILISKRSFDAINQNTYYFIPNHLDQKKLLSVRKKVKENLIEAFLSHSD